MIKINLLGDDTVIDTSGTWLVIGYVLTVICVVMLWAWLFVMAIATVDDLSRQKETLERELKTLQETTKKVRELEKQKKDLAEKTNVIDILKKSKKGPVRVLDDLNNAIPEKAWVTDIKERSGVIIINGLALDNQTIAAFMRGLEASNYFDAINLGQSVEEQRDGVRMMRFTIDVSVNYAGFPNKKRAAEPSPTPSLTPSPEAAAVTTEASPSPTAAEGGAAQ